MKVLIDTNIVLDILLHRQPWYRNAALVFSLTKQNFFQSYVSATTITDIFYLARKDLGKNGVKDSIKNLLQVFHPATVSDSNIYQALDLEWNDFEDSVQFVVGEGLAVEYIITRNVQDFASGSITALTPEQFIEQVTGSM